MARPVEIPDATSFHFAIDGPTYAAMCEQAAREGVTLAAYARRAVAAQVRRDRSRRRQAAA